MFVLFSIICRYREKISQKVNVKKIKLLEYNWFCLWLDQPSSKVQTSVEGDCVIVTWRDEQVYAAADFVCKIEIIQTRSQSPKLNGGGGGGGGYVPSGLDHWS
jgi:hypothetical protein